MDLDDWPPSRGLFLLFLRTRLLLRLSPAGRMVRVLRKPHNAVVTVILLELALLGGRGGLDRVALLLLRNQLRRPMKATAKSSALAQSHGRGNLERPYNSSGAVSW